MTRLLAIGLVGTVCLAGASCSGKKDSGQGKTLNLPSPTERKTSPSEQPSPMPPALAAGEPNPTPPPDMMPKESTTPQVSITTPPKPTPRPKTAKAPPVVEGLHFYDVVVKREFVVPREKMEEYLTPDIMMLPPFMQYVKSDVNGGKKTALPMERCPACKKYFISESWLKAKGNPQMMTDMKRVCTHCGTDIDQWYRDQYRKRRGRR